MLPVINKAGGTLDRVNRELDKVDLMTTSATDAVKAADTAVRTVSSAVTYPVQKIAGLTAALRYGISSFLSGRNFDEAMRDRERGRCTARARSRRGRRERRHLVAADAAPRTYNRTMRTTDELREGFLAFFEERGHLRVPSASLVPRADDRSTLLTSAGMQPMMPYFLGLEPPPAPLLTTSQKSFRTPDIDEVGLDGHHLTFFEMLGNFSFGQYFKEGAIEFAREFVSEHMRLDWDRIWVTVHAGDPQLKLGPDEVAIELWQRVGMPIERIVPLPTAENFWSVGGPGPCGPDSELYYDWGEQHGCGEPDCAPACTRCARFLEFWNLVFMAYEQHPDGTLTPLPKENIDTGLGLERGAAILQDVMSVYETDGYQRIMEWIAAESGVALRRLARRDEGAPHPGRPRSRHDLPRGRRRQARRTTRRATFCVASSGARSCRHGASGSRTCGGCRRWSSSRWATPIPSWDARPPRSSARSRPRRSASWRRSPAASSASKSSPVSLRSRRTTRSRSPPPTAFPIELTVELAEERGQQVDVDGLRALMAEHKDVSRGAAVDLSVPKIDGPETDFVGYEKTEVLTAIAALEEDEPGRFRAKLHESPFYPEGGGQVSDVGFIEHEETGARAELVRAVRTGDDQTLLFEGEGFAVEDRVRAVVPWSHRFPTMANHTATHLLHRALRDVLGDHVEQAGSAVRPDKLRFDFTHTQALSHDERVEIEKRVNEKVFENLPVLTYITPKEEARKLGATMLFTEKYGEDVRVVEIPGYSIELCGGTHVRTTAEIGPIVILSESSVGAGARRIEAVTSGEAYALLHGRANEADGLRSELERARKEKPKEAVTTVDVAADVKLVDGVHVIVQSVEGLGADALLDLSDRFKQQNRPAAVALGTAENGRVHLVCNFDDTVAERVSASDVVKAAAAHVGGGGGGRPTMARAGGTDAAKLGDALAEAERLIVAALS